MKSTPHPGRLQSCQRLRAQPLVLDAHTHVGADPTIQSIGAFPYCLSVEDLVLRLDRTGLDAAVCCPFVYTEYFAFRAFRNGCMRRDPRAESRCPYEFENQRLCMEVYTAFPQYALRLLPFAMFDPGRRPARQAACMRELASRHPLYGLKTATSYLRSHITALLGVGAPILDTARDLDVPVLIHTAVIPGDPWANVFEILKVVEARPDVRFCLAHTCRFDRRALQRAAALSNCFVDFSAFHIHCLLCMQESDAVASPKDRFPADFRDHAGAMRQIAEAFPETMVWGTDTPANLFLGRFVNDAGESIWMELPCAPDTEAAELRKLPPALRRRISYTNTMRLLFG